ncbi:MAG: YdcH family protein, partial [Zymomonas mobilis subsp. pomaceae]
MNNDALLKQLNLLRQEHRDLDIAIEALALNAPAEQLRLARMKKRKLRLRDEIALIEDQLVP